MKKGFTLIELLVVVLIIGILAAVAVPQYQRAVGKARAAEAKTILSAYLRALQLAHLETGGEGNPSGELSIDLPESQYWDFQLEECVSGNGAWGCLVAAYEKNQMQVYISLKDEGYAKVYGDFSVGFFCTPMTEQYAEKCKNLGFTKYDEDTGVYFEP